MSYQVFQPGRNHRDWKHGVVTLLLTAFFAATAMVGVDMFLGDNPAIRWFMRQ